MGGELFARPAPGRNRNRSCPENLAAGNIVARIADYIDASNFEVMAVFLQGTRAGKCAQLIAILMVISEGPEVEVFPEAITLEL